MHFIFDVELNDPPTAPGLALAEHKAESGTCREEVDDRSRWHVVRFIEYYWYS